MTATYADTIIRTAVDYAALGPEQAEGISVRQDGTLYEVTFCTAFMVYDCYVDESGEVLGFLSEPAEA